MAFKSLLDPSFEYRNASSTDIRITFDRVRREMQEQSLCADAEKPLIEVIRPGNRSSTEPFNRR